MQIYILDNQSGDLVEAEIVEGGIDDMPSKQAGWNFNWRSNLKRKNTEIYVLRLRSDPRSVEGVLQLRQQEGMLIMDLVEIAPHNIGRGDKKFEYVAGCLIAFACRETFKLESNYKGFLTFESKTKLIPWYAKNYYAKVAMGQKMFIVPQDGLKLIETYLNREKH